MPWIFFKAIATQLIHVARQLRHIFIERIACRNQLCIPLGLRLPRYEDMLQGIHHNFGLLLIRMFWRSCNAMSSGTENVMFCIAMRSSYFYPSNEIARSMGERATSCGFPK
jgi:hypothetical protein